MKGITVAFVALALAYLVSGAAFNCSNDVLESGKLYRFNLTSLFHEPQFSDSLYFMGETGDLTYINVCGDTTTTCSPSSPVCRRAGLWSTMGFGDLETQVIKPIELNGVEAGNGVTVSYTNGEYCPGTTGTSAVLHIVCSTGEPTVSALSVSNDGCIVTATIKAPAGCGVLVSSMTGGEVFATVVLVLLLVGVVAYIAIGMVVNWKFKGAQTVPEMIPHKEFWASIPGYVRDGCKFVAHGFKKGDYITL